MKAEIIKMPFKFKRPILALGSQTKNTICFLKGNAAGISQVHPDLSNPADFAKFEKDARYLLNKKPEIIAYDLHPEYQSTKFAMERGLKSCKLLAVQHHHAHIASCMAENKMINAKVIGVVFDGTGLGDNGALWGGEFLISDYKSYNRAAHLKEVALLGGEKAIQEPERLALFWLHSIYKERLLKLGIEFIRGVDKKKWPVLKKMILSGFNSPLASSMGRLFDAAGSVILGKRKAAFEAELAIGLEQLACIAPPLSSGYKFRIRKMKEGYILDPAPVFLGIISGLKKREPKEKIAYKFHLAVAEMTKAVCLVLRKDTGINKIVLSGGVFQNKLLPRLILDLLYKERFEVFTHKSLPCNDSGISLGQALIAAQRLS